MIDNRHHLLNVPLGLYIAPPKRLFQTSTHFVMPGNPIASAINSLGQLSFFRNRRAGGIDTANPTSGGGNIPATDKWYNKGVVLPQSPCAQLAIADKRGSSCPGCSGTLPGGFGNGLVGGGGLPPTGGGGGGPTGGGGGGGGGCPPGAQCGMPAPGPVSVCPNGYVVDPTTGVSVCKQRIIGPLME